MQQLDPNIEVIWGTSTDNSLGKDVKVIILAAGIAKEMRAESNTQPQPTMDDEYFRSLMEQLYASPKAAVRTVVEKRLEFEDNDNEDVNENDKKEEEGKMTEQELMQEESAPAKQAQTESAQAEPAQAEPAPSSFQSFLQRAKDWLMNLTNE